MLSPNSPILLLIGSIGLYLLYILEKYLIIYVYKKDYVNQDINNKGD